MTNDTKDNQALEHLFEAAQAAPTDLTPAFRARLDRDIEKAVGNGAPRRETSRTRGWRLLDWLPAAGGLAAAAVSGVVIGLNTDAPLLLSPASDTDETLTLSAFFAGADPGVFFLDEDGS